MFWIIFFSVYGIIGFSLGVWYVVQNRPNNEEIFGVVLAVLLCTFIAVPLVIAQGTVALWGITHRKHDKLQKQIIDEQGDEILKLKRRLENAIKEGDAWQQRHHFLEQEYKKLQHDDPIEKMRREIGLGIEEPEQKLTVRPPRKPKRLIK